MLDVNGATILNPGIPEVTEQIVKVIREIVQNYDIDGVLFDDYFYLSGTPKDSSGDGDLYSAYTAAGGKLSHNDWRRDNVNKMVAAVYNMIQEEKPWVRFGISPAGTVIVVLAKGTLCGLIAALMYRVLCQWNKYAAIVTAAVICPIVNTGIYLIGCLTVFFSAIEGMIGEAMPSVMSVLIYGMGLINFPFELLFNIVLCPVVYRLIKLLPKFAHE
jgi:hypothetical protein